MMSGEKSAIVEFKLGLDLTVLIFVCLELLLCALSFIFPFLFQAHILPSY